MTPRLAAGPHHGYLAAMPVTPDQILARLAALGIEQRTAEHPPVFTVEQARAHTADIPGGHCKNLFLKDKKDRLWLLTCLDEQPVDLGRLARLVGSARLSFGRPELLREVLGVEPGSVTPLAIVNDARCRVTAVIDAGLLRHTWINCHPLRNNATTSLRAADLLRFVRATGHEPVIVDLDGAPPA